MFPYFYNTYGNMGIYYAVILAVVILVAYMILPKRLILHKYEESFKKSNYKFFYSFILLLENIFGVTFCVYLLSSIFIPTGNFYIMLGLIATVLVALSYYQPKDVMELSTIFILIGYFILTLTLFFYPNLDVSLLLPFRETSMLAIPVFAVLCFGVNLTFLINKKDMNFSKMNFVMAIFVSFILFIAEYFILVTNSGDTYFKGLNWVGFISLSIEPITKYIGNFEFAYVFYILISCIFKYSYNLSLIRSSLDLNNKLVSTSLFAMLVILGSVCFLCIPMEGFFLKVVTVLMLCNITILFWFIKECYYVRKTKE